MGIISAIELTKSRAVIYVDGIAFLKIKRKDFDELPLVEGDDLNEQEYIDRLCAKQFSPAYETALNLLTARDMTVHDLQNSLKRRGFLAPVTESVCRRLMENHLLDDVRYAQRYVELRQDASIGRYAIKRKLRSKGIDEQTAENVLETLDDESQLAAASQLARKLSKKYENGPPYARKSKLSQSLARRGFSWEIIREAVDSLEIEDGDSDW